MRIQYTCPFCADKVIGEYDTFVKHGPFGAEYSCVCPKCLSVSIVAVSPAKMFFSRILNKLIEYFLN